jgi:hypothetical protein
MVEILVNNKLPVIGTFWKKLKRHLSDKTFTLHDWKIFINEHKKKDTVIPDEVINEFLDIVITIQGKNLTSPLIDMLFNLIVNKYKVKKIKQKISLQEEK